jgi:hypothetical protein
MPIKSSNSAWRLFGAMSLLIFCATNASSAFAQCSTAAWSSETGGVQAIGEGTSPSGKKYEQNCALTVNAADVGYVTTTAPIDETLIATRFYFYPGEMNLASGDVNIFTARDDGTTQALLAVRQVGGELKLVVKYRSNGSTVEHGETFRLLPTWQAVTLIWGAGAGNGTLTVMLDGEEQLNLSNLVNGSEVVNEIDMGVLNDPSASGPLVFDAFETRRALPAPPLLTVNELFNISTRALVGSGRLSVPAGFAVVGDTKKCVLLRARGQSINLPPSETKVEDPTLTLVRLSDQTQVDFNDNWQDHPAADIITASGRAPADPSDAAIYTCLDPGNYTATMRPVAGKTLGIGIVEAIDLDQGTPFFINISTRAEAKVGRERIVAGFIIEGDQPRTVLIKGRGPSINLPNTTLLDDPTLLLRDSGGVTLETNDNWEDAANVADITATGRAPTNPFDSAILTTLQPGAYTAIVASVNNASGVGIVEVVDIGGGSIEAN